VNVAGVKSGLDRRVEVIVESHGEAETRCDGSVCHKGNGTRVHLSRPKTRCEAQDSTRCPLHTYREAIDADFTEPSHSNITHTHSRMRCPSKETQW